MDAKARLGQALVRVTALLRRLGLLRGPFSRFLYEAAYRKYKLHYEGCEVVRAARFIREGSTVLDIGANIGVLTELFAKRVGADGRVIAIEPETYNMRRLAERLDRCGLKGRIELFEGVATNYVGQAKLAVSVDHPGDHHIAGSGQFVAATTVDAMLEARDLPSVSFIKIDVQGAEECVIEGMERCLERDSPLLCVEVDNASLQRFGSTAQSLLDRLRHAGFKPAIVRNSILQLLPPDKVQEKVNRRGYCDILFAKSGVLRS